MSELEHLAICPGTFDPIHNGHLDIIRRVSVMFGRVIVVIARDPQKQPLFSLAEREALVREVCGDLPTVEVETFDGLLTDYVRSHGVVAIVKGLRTADDFQTEQQMAMMNRALLPEADTILMMTSPEALYISSTLVKEVHALGGDVSGFVPVAVAKALADKSQ